MIASFLSKPSEMTCNTVTDYGDQDEWTPYIAFPLQNAKELFFSYPMKCKSPDHILWKNGSCQYMSPSKEICPVFRKHLLVTLNPSIPENIYDNDNDNDNNNEQITEKFRLNEISTFNKNVQSEKTVEIWAKLRKSCKAKSRTQWQDSLENTNFLQTLGIEKSTSSNDKDRDVSLYRLQRCTCKDFRDANKNEERFDEIIDSDDECPSPCLCPKYFIAKSGLVFGSLEEKQCFDEKMDKMEEVFKSELRTIKEQHERLRVDFIPKQPDNDLES